jgi:hypothetical protein
MAYTDLDQYQKTDDVLVQELEGEAVLLNLANELYYGLDEVGYRMYTLITSADSLQSAYKTLLQEYDVAPEQLEQDFDRLVEELIASGLIARVDG